MNRDSLSKMKTLLLLLFSGLIAGLDVSPGVGSNSFTVVLLPDTQYYSLRDPQTYHAQTNWIVENEAAENIKFVIHLGDITHQNTIAEWLVADQAHKALDDSGIPYSIVPGNHDNPQGGRKRDTSRFNTYFGPSRYSAGDSSWYGGHKDQTNDNNFTFFSIDSLHFMVLSLEFAPRKEAVCWADSVVREFQDHRVIVVTHCYQDHGGIHRQNCNSAYDIIGSAGNDLWNEFVRRHSNIFLVLSGHVGDSERRERAGNAGNVVYEILTDYQFEKRNGQNHGNGWMRTLRFYPAGDSIEIETFTVLDDVTEFNQNDYNPDPAHSDHAYTLPYVMSDALPPYVYTKESRAFNDRTVNVRSKGQQRWPSLAMDEVGGFTIAWEDDSEEPAGAYQSQIRGFFAEGCERLSDFAASPDMLGNKLKPTVAMSDDGRIVVVWEDDRDGDGFYQVYASSYHSDGTKIFDDIKVNDINQGQQLHPAVAIDASGKFFVCWQDDQDEDGIYDIFAACFDADGNKLVSDFTVNSDVSSQQISPRMTTVANGGFVITWEAHKGGIAMNEIFAAGFNGMGQKLFGDITVNSVSSGPQQSPDIASDLNGNFVITWEDDKDGNGTFQIYAAGFDDNGSRIIADFTVNGEASGQQRNPRVSMYSNGGFTVVWEDDQDRNGFYQIYAAGFDDTGNKVVGDFTVNDNSSGQQLRPVIATNSNDYCVIAWEDDIDNDGVYEIVARGLDVNKSPITAIGIEETAIPNNFELYQNYPNPFNSVTTIKYDLLVQSVVDLTIFSILGHETKTLIHENQLPGQHVVKWNGLDNSGKQSPSGIYFVRLQVGSSMQVRKIILQK